MLGAAGQQLSLDEFLWGKLAVLTRTFGVERGNGTLHGHNHTAGHDQCMVPYADLFNHSPQPNMAWALRDGRFQVFATQAIRANEALTFSYGNYESSHLLSIYGFIQADNRYDEARVLIEEADFSDQAFEGFRDGLARHGLRSYNGVLLRRLLQAGGRLLDRGLAAHGLMVYGSTASVSPMRSECTINAQSV